jgi:hypothetical protein
MILMMCLLLASALLVGSCRIEKRLVEVGVREASSARFRFESDGEGLNGQAFGWSKAVRYAQTSVSITPSQPGSLAGFGGLGRRLFPPRLYPGTEPTVYCRPYKDVESEPRMKLVLLEGVADMPSGSALEGEDSENGDRRLFLIINLDLVAVTQDVTQWLLDEANQFLTEQGGFVELSHASFQVTATHTHSGPSGLSLSPLWGAFACDSYQSSYRAEIRASLRQGLALAIADLADISSLTVHHAEIAGLNTSRFKGMGVDTDAFLLLARTQDGAISGCQFSYPVHSTYFGPNSLRLSRDLAGWLEGAMTETLGRIVRSAAECFFLNGLSGNATANYEGRNADDYSQLVASQMGERASPVIRIEDTDSRSGDQAAGRVSYAAVSYDLPPAAFNFGACNAEAASGVVSLPFLETLPRSTKLAALRLTDDFILFAPGELVFEAGELLRQRIRDSLGSEIRVSLVTTANDYSGYVLPANKYDEKALESCSSLYGKGHIGSVDQGLSDLIRAFQK